MVNCPNCSTPLPDNVRYCTKCGAKIEGNTKNQTEWNSTRSSYDNTTNQPINDPIESLKESGKDFMRDIGNYLNKVSESSRSRKRYCPNCSTVLPNNVKFCTKCGTPFEEKSPREEKTKKTEFEKLEYLEKLAELKEKGIISEVEFEKKKKEILKLDK